MDGLFHGKSHEDPENINQWMMMMMMMMMMVWGTPLWLWKAPVGEWVGIYWELLASIVGLNRI